MRIVQNESSYDTRAVRRVLQAVARTFQKYETQVRWWTSLRVHLLNGRARVRIVGASAKWDIYLPQLQGTEFIGLLRQQHGGTNDVDHGGLTAEQLALIVQVMLYRAVERNVPSWAQRVLLNPAHTLRGIPKRISLRIIKPVPPRDKLRERLERTRELEKSWQRKAKLAATKIKKLKQRRLRYEKQLAQREAV